jgi:hypothetical protein
MFVVFGLCGANFLPLKVSRIGHYLLTVSNPVVTIICYFQGICIAYTLYLWIYFLPFLQKFAFSAYSVHQFVIPMPAVGQSQLNYFGNRKTLDREILQISFSLQGVNTHCVCETGIGYCVESAMHVNSSFRFLLYQRLHVPSVLLRTWSFIRKVFQ